MANHTRGPRGRSRKPRPHGAATQPVKAPPTDGVKEPSTDAVKDASARRARGGHRAPAYRSFEDRPQAPWHPLPLSELLIVVGAVAFVVAMIRLGNNGVASGGPLLLVGVLAIGLGTAEVSWREHRSGFRSHTLLLAFVPVLALHTAVVLALSPLLGVSQPLNIAMLPVDVAVFAVLARYLRARFINARARR
ncbi:MAG TPA: hypothetical protein VFW38_07000 [Solirubrobacteraceae bacterium]|nr:hypothetical protein [Solirubrobacteraceae bacterium]